MKKAESHAHKPETADEIPTVATGPAEPSPSATTLA